MKLDLGAAWNEATAMMSANKELLLVLGGIFFLVPALLVAAIVPAVPQMPIATSEDFERLVEAALEIFYEWWEVYAIVLLVQMLGYLSIIALLRDVSRPSVGQAISDGAAALLPALLSYILFVAGVSLLLTLLSVLTELTSGWIGIITVPLMLIAMIYLPIKASMAAPVIAVDKVRNPLMVLSRSWKLTKGNSLRIFAFFVLIAVVYFVLSILLGFLMQLVAALLGPDVGSLILGVISGIVSAIGAIVMIAAIAAVHRQLSGSDDKRVSQTFE